MANANDADRRISREQRLFADLEGTKDSLQVFDEDFHNKNIQRKMHYFRVGMVIEGRGLFLILNFVIYYIQGVCEKSIAYKYLHYFIFIK